MIVTIQREQGELTASVSIPHRGPLIYSGLVRPWTIRQIDGLTQAHPLYDWLLVISVDEDCL